MFGLLDRLYKGLTLRSAIYKWSGGNDANAYISSVSRALGVYPGTVLTSEFLRSDKGIALAKAMARIEAGRPFPLSDEKWRQAHDRVFKLSSLSVNPFMDVVTEHFQGGA